MIYFTKSRLKYEKEMEIKRRILAILQKSNGKNKKMLEKIPKCVIY